MSVAVAGAWALVVVVGFARRPPVPPRVRALRSRRHRPPPRWAADERVRRGAAGVVGAGLALLVLPALAPVLLVAGWVVPAQRARRRQRQRAEALRRELPEVVDLVALAVDAGLTVPQTILAVGRRHPGRLGAGLLEAAGAVGRGRRCGDALDDLAAALGPDVRPLLAALASSERYGAPLGDALVRLAADARADRRRRAEEAARRVPVKLLFPLVLCVLPAFALLTVAPLLAGALGSLRL